MARPVSPDRDAIARYVQGHPTASLKEIQLAVYGSADWRKADVVRRALIALGHPVEFPGAVGRALAQVPAVVAAPCPTCGHITEPRWTVTPKGEAYLARRGRR